MISRHQFTLAAVVGLLLTMSSAHLSAQLPAPTATGTPSSFKVTVTKVEMFNGSTWVQIFSGSSELNLISLGTFPGISSLNFPAGSYTKARVTIVNAFKVTGGINLPVDVPDGPANIVYVTSTAAGSNGLSGLSAGTLTAPGSEFTFSNPAWGVSGASVLLDEFTLPSTVVVNASTNYSPVLKFNVVNTLSLYQLGVNTWGIGLTAPTVQFLDIGLP